MDSCVDFMDVAARAGIVAAAWLCAGAAVGIAAAVGLAAGGAAKEGLGASPRGLSCGVVRWVVAGAALKPTPGGTFSTLPFGGG
mmetsp:Transcript_73796/g.190454  ORF Transcript_73796/g.190454 Transcript_73796/m.190454 type:complete len:84 (+) Transcript_73796:106-357(+)